VSDLESQPFYVNSPFGITLAHNGNLTNSEALKKELFQLDFRHVNTNSDFGSAAQRARAGARTFRAPRQARRQRDLRGSHRRAQALPRRGTRSSR